MLVDTAIRTADEIAISSEMYLRLGARLAGLKPLLEDHFRTKLQGLEDPVCLAYQSRSFYKPHRDVSIDRNAPENVRHRVVTAILFSNAETEHGLNNSYSGGSLAFYGIMKFSGWEDYGVSVKGRQGLLVAFPSETLHEVQIVKAGLRTTIATWY